MAVKGTRGRPRERPKQARRRDVGAAQPVADKMAPPVEAAIEPVELDAELPLNLAKKRRARIHASDHESARHRPHEASEARLRGGHAIDSAARTPEAFSQSVAA